MKAGQTRANREQVKARTGEIVRILLDGAMGLDVVDYIREKEAEQGSLWFVAEGQQPIHYATIRRYVDRAEKLVADDCKIDRKKMLARHLARRERLYGMAVSQGDCRAALSILDSQAKLLGLFPSSDESTKAGSHGPTTINIFERATFLANQLRQPAALDRPVPPGAFPGNGCGESMGQAHPDDQAERVPIAS